MELGTDSITSLGELELVFLNCRSRFRRKVCILPILPSNLEPEGWPPYRALLSYVVPIGTFQPKEPFAIPLTQSDCSLPHMGAKKRSISRKLREEISFVMK